MRFEKVLLDMTVLWENILFFAYFYPDACKNAIKCVILFPRVSMSFCHFTNKSVQDRKSVV